ncbi:MAG: lysine--tRNA ligase [Halobacteriales archaeon]|nr:lysine--tRNA ligase [Halobacteriales archaeon]
MSDDADYRVFWADEYADAVEARSPDDPIVIKGAVSPSGIPHIGHFNEILRGYFVAEVLRERGHEVRQVFGSDDRDALRKLPRRLADADWNLVDLGAVDAAALGENLGVPYADIPDPFGECHASYGDHFAALLEESAAAVGVPIEMVSTTELYATGVFDDAVRTALEKRELARELLAEYQAGVDEEYVPFMPQCAECGRLTTSVLDVDLESATVEYACEGLEAGGQQIDGCGHRGTATFREGKLSWRFEWPAGWAALGVDFEPFGKDHAEGSWPSGQRIAREVFDIEPPEPMVYEWFTLGGEALSSSSGNVVTVPELLELIEPEVLRYFFALNPRKQRDLDVASIDRLVDDFDGFEAAYFGEADGADDRELAFAERAYPFVVDEVREARVRLPYTFAAVLGMTDDRDLRLEMARREGHLPEDAPEWAIEAAMDRVERARRWAERTDNEYNYRLQADRPDVELDPATRAALDELADHVEAGLDGETLQGEVYETAKRHDLAVGDFFGAGYELFLGQPRGPRLGPLLAALDREFVVDRLRGRG